MMIFLGLDRIFILTDNYKYDLLYVYMYIKFVCIYILALLYIIDI